MIGIAQREEPSSSGTLVVWGAAGHAIVLLDLLDIKNYNEIIFIDRDMNARSPVEGAQIFRTIDQLKVYMNEVKKNNFHYVVAIGGDRGVDRRVISSQLSKLGGYAVSVIAETAIVSPTAQVGQATQLLSGVYIGPRVEIGINTIINNNASIDHETKIGSECHVAPGAVLCGCVEVGNCSFIGAGAVVLPRTNIGDKVTVGAGSLVNSDIPPNSVVVGNPAKIIRQRD